MDKIEDIQKALDEYNAANDELNDLAEVLKFQKERFAPFEDMGIQHLENPAEGIQNFMDNAEKNKQTIADLAEQNLYDELSVRESEQAMYDNKMSDAVSQHEADQAVQRETLDAQDNFLWNSVIGDEFRTSPFFNGENSKTILPSEIAISLFIDHFSVEVNDKGYPICVAYDEAGNRMMTQGKPGSLTPFKIDPVPPRPMSFNEAIGVLVNKRPDIMRAGLHGSGGKGNTSNGESSRDVLNRKYRDAMSKGNVSEAIAIKNKLFKQR